MSGARGVAGALSRMALGGIGPSAVSAQPRGTGPVSTTPPSIIGRAIEGTRLVASLGSWENATSFATSWRRCSSACCTAAGSDASYLLGSADLGSRVELRVTAFNSQGSTDATSRPTEPVAAAPPLAVHLPAISGSLSIGPTLSADAGRWSGTGSGSPPPTRPAAPPPPP